MCNLLPTGLYNYTVGTHRPNSRYPQLGAFLQSDAVPVLRCRNKLIYELPPTDRFDGNPPHIVGDDIHAGILERSPRPPFYSSAGCQVIPGGYNSTKTAPYGKWAAFRELAGLKPLPEITNKSPSHSSDDGRRFHYMLLTGSEAELAAQNRLDDIGPRIRMGSSGDVVAKLRNALKLSTASRFDGVMMNRIIQWQQNAKLPMDGILTQAAANSILGSSN